MSDDKHQRDRELLALYATTDNPQGWIEALYAEAAGDPSKIPWGRLRPMPPLVDWLDSHAPRGRTLVVGCGLGDDAEELARRGLRVTAFDLSESAIDWCRRRFPASTVHYQVANALDPPQEFTRAFDFIVEVATIQTIPSELRPRAFTSVANCLAPGGTLLVICRGRDPGDDPGRLPWPLTWDDLAAFDRAGLVLTEGDEVFDNEDPPVRRFRACYTRP